MRALQVQQQLPALARLHLAWPHAGLPYAIFTPGGVPRQGDTMWQVVDFLPVPSRVFNGEIEALALGEAVRQAVDRADHEQILAFQLPGQFVCQVSRGKPCGPEEACEHAASQSEGRQHGDFE